MKKIIAKISVSLFLILIFMVLFLMRGNAAFVEFWSTKVAAGYFKIVGRITGIFPYSVYELTLYAVILFVIITLVFLILNLCRAKLKKAINKVMNIVLLASGILCLYYMTTGLTYHRDSHDVPQYHKTISNPQIQEIANFFVEEYNELASQNEFDEDGNVISPYTFDELSEKILDIFETIDSDHLYDYRPPIKKWLFSRILTEMKTTGVYFAPTAESNINSDLLDIETPFTIAHEISHAKGVMNEGDANLYAMYVTLLSDDPYIKLSGFFFTFYSLLDLVYYTSSIDDYLEVRNSICPEIQRQQANHSAYWSKPTLLNKIQKYFYDIYLRFNGSDKGIEDYTSVEDKTDTGEVDSAGRPIYEVTNYSTYQKLYIYLYMTEQSLH